MERIGLEREQADFRHRSECPPSAAREVPARGACDSMPWPSHLWRGVIRTRGIAARAFPLALAMALWFPRDPVRSHKENRFWPRKAVNRAGVEGPSANRQE